MTLSSSLLCSQGLRMKSPSLDIKNEKDNIWPFDSSSSSSSCDVNRNSPTLYKSSKYGNVYKIDLMAMDEHKQTKPRNQCRDGESSIRYVYNLGQLTMMSLSNYGNADSTPSTRRSKCSSNGKILCLHRHKVWWMKPVFIDCSINIDGNGDGCTIPPESVFILGLDRNGYDENQKDSKKQYRLILPLILPDGDGCTSCSLRSSTTTNTNHGDIELHSETGGNVILYCGISDDPFKLIDDGNAMASLLAKSADEDLIDDMIENTTQNIRLNNSLPPFAQKLGWCTWNAFYTQFNGEKIISAIKTLQNKNIPVKWMILDDGWQHTTNDSAEDGMQWGERLFSVHGPSPLKFSLEKDGDSKLIPNSDCDESIITSTKLLSLKETVSILKRPIQQAKPELNIENNNDGHGLGLESVLAWHALPGYWLGLSSQTEHDNYSGPSTTLFYPHFSTNLIENDASLMREISITKGIGIANNATLFYEQYHSFLETCGFDGVKVDAQGVSGVLRSYSSHGNIDNFDSEQSDFDKEHRHVVSHHLQDALALSIKLRFSSNKSTHNEKVLGALDALVKSLSNNIIMCMCHSPDIIYRLAHLYSDSKPLMRVSDDFYPDNRYCHGPHLVACAFNSLLLGSHCIPDYDMFTTESTITGEMHAMARAISGGPIYFSDKPHQANSSIIEKLVCKNGMILCCSYYARPTRDTLLNDPLGKDSAPMILWNVNGQHIDTKKGEITSGVLGIFNIGASGKWCYDELTFIESQGANEVVAREKTVTISPSDVEPFLLPKYQSTKFATVSSHDGLLGILCVSESIVLEVKYLHAQIIHFLPIHQVEDCLEFIVLGLSTLYNFSGAVKNVSSNVIENNFDHQSSSLKRKKKFIINIETLGCGYFLVCYKFAQSLLIEENKTLHVHYNGEIVEHHYFLSDNNEEVEKLRQVHPGILDEAQIHSFVNKGFHIHCIDIPDAQDEVTRHGQLEIVIELYK